MTERSALYWKGLTFTCLAYLTAWAAASTAGWLLPIESPFWLALAADLVATVVVFGFSVAVRNSSMYDAYWSVVPPVIAVYWALSLAGDTHPVRAVMVCGVILVWAVRLTWNWASGWPGLHHEDWRYTRLKQQTGALYPLVNFAGIHLFPTLIVFLCLWPAWEALDARSSLGLLDFVALGTGLFAVWLEGTADRQARAWRATNPPAGAVNDMGLWRLSRHPNYLGEILFWTSLWLFALAASPQNLFTVVGPLAMAAMFRFITIPMMEQRQLARRPAYVDYMRRTSMLLLWPSRGRRPSTDDDEPSPGPAQAPAGDVTPPATPAEAGPNFPAELRDDLPEALVQDVDEALDASDDDDR